MLCGTGFISRAHAHGTSSYRPTPTQTGRACGKRLSPKRAVRTTTETKPDAINCGLPPIRVRICCASTNADASCTEPDVTRTQLGRSRREPGIAGIQSAIGAGGRAHAQGCADEYLMLGRGSRQVVFVGAPSEYRAPLAV